ncbi:hypothetical protein C8R42DRAFT_709458 [Lentinula raphanica]|nr:hypothetical protein C8R42DRAFT_709458 [Lentinula raphanica]
MNMTRHPEWASDGSQYNNRPTRPKSSRLPNLPPLSIPSTPSLSNGSSSSPPLSSRVASSQVWLGAANTYSGNDYINEEYDFDRYSNNWNHTSSEVHADGPGQRSTLDERSVRQYASPSLSIWTTLRYLIIPCRPNLPNHLSNGGFIRSHPTDENTKTEYYMHGSRFDSHRKSSMRSKPDSVSSAAKRGSPKSPSPSKQRKHISTTTSTHSATLELCRASGSRDPLREEFEMAQMTTKGDGIQTIDQLHPSVDPDTTRTAVPPKRLRRFRRVLSTLAKLLQKQ